MVEIPLKEIRDIRLNKAASLRERGINPYPAKCSRNQFAEPILSDYDSHESKQYTLAGRLMSWRSHGALSFGHIQDQTGRLQLYIRQDTLQDRDLSPGIIGYNELDLIDVGDFIEATGIVMKTQRGEISLNVSTIRILTKSLRPLPDKRVGLKDREAILRKRYLDTTIHPENRGPFEIYGKILAAIRSFLNDWGFLEFKTPIIQPQYGGGSAKPFITHVNALGTDMYLAISHELYLKRLIAAGFDKVYTIGGHFRNEGIDRSHNPEFSMLETMTAYENFEYNMNLIEEMFRHVGKTVFGKTVFPVKGHTVDFGTPWQRKMMVDVVLEVTGIDFRKISSVEEANNVLTSLKIKDHQPSVGEALVQVFAHKVEETLITPTFIYGHPVEISPLAKPMDNDPRYAERFEIFIAGMECGDNWSEQNDPIALLDRWKKNYDPKKIAEGEFQPLDYDFLEVLEHGIPPTTGIGPGIERMVMIFTEQENIDNVIFFPMMRPRLSSINAAIYGIDSETEEEKEEEPVHVTMEQFESLLVDGILKPSALSIVVRPQLRIWKKSSSEKPSWIAFGHLEVSGLNTTSAVTVSGYSVDSKTDFKNEIEGKKYRELVLQKLERFTGTILAGRNLNVFETRVIGGKI